MTARLIPEQPEYEGAAERVFVEALREQLPDDAVILANQRFTDRRGDLEADVLVLWPGFGVGVVEVKGGHVRLAEGKWQQHWRSASTGWRFIDPVNQARRCKYALRTWLDRHERWSRGNVRTVHLVALPGVDLDATFAAPDAPRWLVMDRSETPYAASRIEAALRQVEGQPSPPTHADIEALVDCLVGAAISQKDVLARLHEREDICEALSRDQGRVLDLLGSQSRVEIRGGAGSGKTWLAVEKARRLAKDGQRVALMCYSRGLAEYLKRRVEILPPAQRPSYVGTFHGLGTGWGVLPGSDDDSAYWEHTLPEMMVSLAGEQPLTERFDAVVVDEAQDFAETWWPAVLAALRAPDTGSLYVFSDEKQRVFARQGRPPVALTLIDLNENMRNTKQIAGTFSSLAPALMKVRGGDGDPVQFLQCAPTDAIDAADGAVERLMDEDWPAESIALLTTYNRHPVQVEQQAEGQEAYWAQFWEKDWPFYGHVLGFKGLERPAIVLAVNGFRDRARAQEMLYVGLSRARDLLVVCGDLEEIRSIAGGGVATRLERARIEL